MSNSEIQPGISAGQPPDFVEVTLVTPVGERPYEEVVADLARAVMLLDAGQARLRSVQPRTKEEIYGMPTMGEFGELQNSRLLCAPRNTLGLTTHEKIILALVAHGMSNSKVSAALKGSSVNGIKNTLKGVYEKLHTTNRTVATGITFGIHSELGQDGKPLRQYKTPSSEALATLPTNPRQAHCLLVNRFLLAY